jgi:hypothetical protein
MKTIYKFWEDIGKKGLKFFRGNMIEDMEDSCISHIGGNH